MDKEKILTEIEREKEIKINSIMYDLERESFTTASWTLNSLIELKGQEKLLKKMGD